MRCPLVTLRLLLSSCCSRTRRSRHASPRHFVSSTAALDPTAESMFAGLDQTLCEVGLPFVSFLAYSPFLLPHRPTRRTARSGCTRKPVGSATCCSTGRSCRKTFRAPYFPPMWVAVKQRDKLPSLLALKPYIRLSRETFWFERSSPYWTVEIRQSPFRPQLAASKSAVPRFGEA